MACGAVKVHCKFGNLHAALSLLPNCGVSIETNKLEDIKEPVLGGEVLPKVLEVLSLEQPLRETWRIAVGSLNGSPFFQQLALEVAATLGCKPIVLFQALCKSGNATDLADLSPGNYSDCFFGGLVVTMPAMGR